MNTVTYLAMSFRIVPKSQGFQPPTGAQYKTFAPEPPALPPPATAPKSECEKLARSLNIAIKIWLCLFGGVVAAASCFFLLFMGSCAVGVSQAAQAQERARKARLASEHAARQKQMEEVDKHFQKYMPTKHQ